MKTEIIILIYFYPCAFFSNYLNRFSICVFWISTGCGCVSMATMATPLFFTLFWLLRMSSSAFPEEPGPLNFIPAEGIDLTDSTHLLSLSPLGLGLHPTQVSRCGELWRVMWRVMEVREFECGHTKRCWLFSGQKVLGQNLEREQSVGERQTHSWPLNPHSYIQLYRCRHHNTHTTIDKATRTVRLFLSKPAWQSWTKAWLNAPPLYRLIFFYLFFYPSQV